MQPRAVVVTTCTCDVTQVCSTTHLVGVTVLHSEQRTFPASDGYRSVTAHPRHSTSATGAGASRGDSEPRDEPRDKGERDDELLLALRSAARREGAHRRRHRRNARQRG